MKNSGSSINVNNNDAFYQILESSEDNHQFAEIFERREGEIDELFIIPRRPVTQEAVTIQPEYTRAQKGGQALLRYVFAYVNTAFHSFPAGSPYKEVWETTATSFNAIVGDITEAFAYQEDLSLNLYAAGWKNNLKEGVKAILPKLMALGIVAGCGYAIGLVSITFVQQFLESESVVERTIGRILDQELLRKPTLFLLSYPTFRFFEFVTGKGIECFFPNSFLYNKRSKKPYINSLQQADKYGRRIIQHLNITKNLFSFANQLGFKETGFSAVHYILLTDAIIYPPTWFCSTRDPINRLEMKSAAELQFGPQRLKRTTSKEDMQEGIKLRLISYALWTGSMWFSSYVLNSAYPDLYKENPKLYYFLNWGGPMTLKFFLHNGGEISTDFSFVVKNTAPIVNKVCAAITPITNYFGSFFKRSKPPADLTQPLLEQKQSENYGAITPK